MISLERLWQTFLFVNNSPSLGTFHAVVLASLDDLPLNELIAAPVRYLDGRNDIWVTPPAETRHL